MTSSDPTLDPQLTPEERQKLDVLMMKIKSDALSDQQRIDLGETSMLALLIRSTKTPIRKRADLARLVQKHIRLNGMLNILDMLSEAMLKHPEVPLLLQVLAYAEALSKLQDREHPQLKKLMKEILQIEDK